MVSNILKQDFGYTYDNLSAEERRRFESATLLITGACGFLGYYFLRFFEEMAQALKIKKVIALDNFMLGHPEWVKDLEQNPLFVIEKFDIVTDDIADIKGADQADYVIHMASIASPMFYRTYPIETIDANIWGLRRLLDYYADKNLRGFLFYSSSEIYGNPDPRHIPTAEDYNGNVSATGPRACYDESKRFGETMCMLFSQKYHLPIGVARPFNNYGPGMKLNDKRVPADFALAIKENRDIEILSTGTPTRTFCYISDAICGYLKILAHGKYDYFNIGIETPEITISELADIYVASGKDIFGYTGKVVFSVSQDKQYLAHNPQRRCPDIKKAREILNYAPSISVYHGVKRFLTFIKENKEREYLW